MQIGLNSVKNISFRDSSIVSIFFRVLGKAAKQAGGDAYVHPNSKTFL